MGWRIFRDQKELHKEMSKTLSWSCGDRNSLFRRYYTVYVHVAGLQKLWNPFIFIECGWYTLDCRLHGSSRLSTKFLLQRIQTFKAEKIELKVIEQTLAFQTTLVPLQGHGNKPVLSILFCINRFGRGPWHSLSCRSDFYIFDSPLSGYLDQESNQVPFGMQAS